MIRSIRKVKLSLQKQYWSFRLDGKESNIIFSYNVKNPKKYKINKARLTFCKSIVTRSLEEFSESKQMLHSVYKQIKC